MDEDKQLRELFNNFNPPDGTPSDIFISRLERNMDAVEEVRRIARASRKRNRIAVTAGAAAGFGAGIVCSHLLPLLTGLIPAIDLPALSPALPACAGLSTLVAWALTATAGVLTAIATYDAVLTGLLPTKE